MKTRILAASALVFALALPALSQTPTPESSVSSAQNLFGSLSLAHFKLSAQPAAIHLEGTVSLYGKVFAFPGGGSATVYLQGQANLMDESGVYTIGPVNVDSSAHVTLSAGWADATAPIDERVPIYKNGQEIGKVRIHGAVDVAGDATNNWVVLSGMGAVTADFTPEASR